MRSKTFWRHAFTFLAAAALALPAFADVNFQVRRMTRQDVPLGTGQCDIRVVVDNEAEISLQADRVYIRTLQGREGRDAGSECNVPLPRGYMEGFNFQVIDGRGEVALVSQPSPRTGSSPVVRIRDAEGGESRYHFRVTWADRGDNFNTGIGRPGASGPPFGRGRGYGRGGRWGDSQGLRFGDNEAMNLCSDTVRDSIARDYRYNEVQVQNLRPDNRTGANDWIIGDAVGRRGFFNQQFSVACRVNYNTGTVQSLDIRRR